MEDENDLFENSDEENEFMTAAEVLAQLEEVWLIEKMSPTLEPNNIKLVECMLDQLSHMNENLRRCKKADFRVAVHKMELDRIRYIISNYMRIRLEKMEKFTHYLLENESKLREEGKQVMTDEEVKYTKEIPSLLFHLSRNPPLSQSQIKSLVMIRQSFVHGNDVIIKYASSLEGHFKKLVLQYFPENLQEFQKDKMSVKPNLDSYIFFKVKENSPGVFVPDATGEGRDEEVDLQKGGQHLMRYNCIEHLLQKNTVQLI